jgi:hypothetical protein
MGGVEGPKFNHATVGIGCGGGAPGAAARAAVKLGRSKMATAASPRWRLLLLTSYPEAGSGDLRRNSYFEKAISAVR